jgi:hypothetical protein
MFESMAATLLQSLGVDPAALVAQGTAVVEAFGRIEAVLQALSTTQAAIQRDQTTLLVHFGLATVTEMEPELAQLAAHETQRFIASVQDAGASVGMRPGAYDRADQAHP